MADEAHQPCRTRFWRRKPEEGLGGREACRGLFCTWTLAIRWKVSELKSSWPVPTELICSKSGSVLSETGVLIDGTRDLLKYTLRGHPMLWVRASDTMTVSRLSIYHVMNRLSPATCATAYDRSVSFSLRKSILWECFLTQRKIDRVGSYLGVNIRKISWTCRS